MVTFMATYFVSSTLPVTRMESGPVTVRPDTRAPLATLQIIIIIIISCSSWSERPNCEREGERGKKIWRGKKSADRGGRQLTRRRRRTLARQTGGRESGRLSAKTDGPKFSDTAWQTGTHTVTPPNEPPTKQEHCFQPL